MGDPPDNRSGNKTGDGVTASRGQSGLARTDIGHSLASM